MAPHRHRSVLVVDDDLAMREVLAEVLAEMGIEPVAAADGVEGLARLRAHGLPCAALVDMKMPRLDGEGFVQAVRADPALRELPVIAMTGDDEEAALDVVGWLHKPFDLGELDRMLASICG